MIYICCVTKKTLLVFKAVQNE